VPGALISIPSIIIAILAFVAITHFKVDVAKVAISAIVIGIGYASWHALQ